MIDLSKLPSPNGTPEEVAAAFGQAGTRAAAKAVLDMIIDHAPDLVVDAVSDNEGLLSTITGINDFVCADDLSEDRPAPSPQPSPPAATRKP